MAKKSPNTRRSRNELEVAEILPSKRATKRTVKTASKIAKSSVRRVSEANDRASVNPLTFKNEAQRQYVSTIRANQLTLGLGPAGTGKTFLAAKLAAMEFDRGMYDGILIVRPIVEAAGSIGHLPGTADEKTAPYQVPVLEALEAHFGKGHLEGLMNGPYPKIEFIAPNFIRGRTFERKFIILDEAQNMTPKEMKTFLTRIGEYSKVVVDGDVDQVDIKGSSGLVDAVEKLKGLDNVGFFEFTEDDIVRSGLVKEIVKRYRSRTLKFDK